MSRHLFVTGMPRSGTTLVDKLLSLHPRAYVLSQPLPLLYVELKRAFLSAHGLPGTAYPLDDMYAGRWYNPATFAEFLESHALSEEFCKQVLKEMVDFDGQYTKPGEPFEVLRGYGPLPLFDFVVRYCILFLPPGAMPDIVGSKETYCEELVPYYLRCGAQVIVILRDPRDIVASLNHGDGARFSGHAKPHLWNLRQWRKSVAFALAHADNRRFLAVRYEDLVTDPADVTGRIADFLGIEYFSRDNLHGELRSQSGEPWHSNSSHQPVRRIDTGSIGRFRSCLDRQTDLWIQALCLPEMRHLGYDVEIEDDDVPTLLDRPPAGDPTERGDLVAYSWTPARRNEELQRFEKLRQGEFELPLFLFKTAFSALHKAVEVTP